MRCPACNAENADGTTVCTACGKDMTQKAAAAPAGPASVPAGRRLSKLAVIALLAGAIAPSMQVQRDLAGGHLFGSLGKSGAFLMFLDQGANVLYAIAILAGLVALFQVAKRADLRGAALAIGGAVMGVGGIAASSDFANYHVGRLAEFLKTLGGGSDSYVWRTTVIILVAAVLCEIVLALASGPAAAPAPAATGKQ